MSGFCLSCGHNLTKDVPIELDGWRVTTTAVFDHGLFAPIVPHEANFLHTLAKAAPFPVSAYTIGQRIGDAQDPAMFARVVARHIRQKLPNPPFETVIGIGYRWAA